MENACPTGDYQTNLSDLQCSVFFSPSHILTSCMVHLVNFSKLIKTQKGSFFFSRHSNALLRIITVA